MSKESILSQIVNWWVGKIIKEGTFKPEKKEKIVRYCLNSKSNGMLPVNILVGMKFIGEIGGKTGKFEVIGCRYISYKIKNSETNEIFSGKLFRDGGMYHIGKFIGRITEII